jgi:hypothetical protein
MNRQEFFEWLNTCPSHDWDIITDETGCTRIVFMYEED